MATEKNKAIDEAQIRRLVDNWTKALRAKDVDGLSPFPFFFPSFSLFTQRDSKREEL
jgi:hypothetical protein